MRAPTQDEIRAAVDALDVSAWDLAEQFWEAAGLATEALWHCKDFRPSEQAAFDAIMEAEAALVQRRVAEILVESSVNVALRVAAELPELPTLLTTADAA